MYNSQPFSQHIVSYIAIKCISAWWLGSIWFTCYDYPTGSSVYFQLYLCNAASWYNYDSKANLLSNLKRTVYIQLHSDWLPFLFSVRFLYWNSKTERTAMTEGSVCRIGLEVSGEQDVLCSPAPLCRISAYMSPGLKDNIPSVTEPPTTTHTHTHTHIDSQSLSDPCWLSHNGNFSKNTPWQAINRALRLAYYSFTEVEVNGRF